MTLVRVKIAVFEISTCPIALAGKYKIQAIKKSNFVAHLASKVSDHEIHYSGVQARTFCQVTTVSWLTSVSHVKRVIYWEPTLFMFRFPLSSIIS
jgi:hypothetical protein